MSNVRRGAPACPVLVLSASRGAREAENHLDGIFTRWQRRGEPLHTIEVSLGIALTVIVEADDLLPRHRQAYVAGPCAGIAHGEAMTALLGDAKHARQPIGKDVQLHPRLSRQHGAEQPREPARAGEQHLIGVCQRRPLIRRRQFNPP